MTLPDYSGFTSQIPDVQKVGQLRDLIDRLLQARAVVAQKEIELAEAQAVERVLSEVDIPQLFEALRIPGLPLPDGSKVEVGRALRTSISAENKPAAHDWLRQNGQDAIIKRTVVAAFGRGDEKRATELVTTLLKQGVSAKSEEKVEPSTLKKVISDMLEGGAPVPMELFGAHVQTFTKIKHPRGE